MQDAPLPEDEALRLAALRSLGLLDTPPEQRFNRITRTAARVLGVPMSTLTLVDSDRQWFKSRYGLFVAETPRRIAFSAHAIMSPELLVVEDTLKDERFSDNPLVTGPPHLRFYAGRPLASPSGRRLGTLCIMGREPRTLSAEDRLGLEDLAAWAEMELNLSAQLAGARRHHMQAMEQVQDGVVLMDAEGTVHWINGALRQWLGIAPTAGEAGLQQVLASQTLEALDKDMSGERLREGPLRLELDAGLQHADGRLSVVRATVHASLVDGERLVSMVIDRSRMRERG